MHTIRKLYESDSTGTVRLDVPVGTPHRRFEIVVVWQEVDERASVNEARAKKRAELEALAGALADNPLLRPEQPSVEARLPLE